MKNKRARVLSVMLLAILVLSLTGCSKKQIIKGAFRSQDQQTLLACDSQLIYVVEDDQISVIPYTLQDDMLIIGDTYLPYEGSDPDSITIGSETYTKTRFPLSLRWRLIKWASSHRIKDAKLGIIQWAILDPIFMEGSNSMGYYSMFGSWMALIGLVLGILIIYIIIWNIRRISKEKKKKRV